MKPQLNLSTHLSRIHKMDGEARKQWLKLPRTGHSGESHHAFKTGGGSMPTLRNEDCERYKMAHPFTCMVVGMTGSEKTLWVKNLLEHAQETIQLPPQRIVWSYSQWQPIYTILQNIIPWIEFVRGIPADLEQDWYFDQKIDNLFVIDDQMQESSNNSQIMNLFTKGSHHRNLSVIFLTQNAYHNGRITRTVSLNCHYLVLFKKPRDKMQVMTLAKQMYPRNTQHFLQKYEEAVQRPYGYWFVDLKPSTPDQCRLRKNVLPGEEKHNSDSRHPAHPTVSNYTPPSFTLSPLLKQMKTLSQEMNADLERADLYPETQVKRYNQHFARFLAMKQMRENRSGPLPLPKPAPSPQDTELSFVNPSLSQEDEIMAPPSPFEFAETPKTSHPEYETPSLSLHKALPYPPEEPQRRRTRPLMEHPDYGTPQYYRNGRWANASEEEIRRARRHMRRTFKAARQLALAGITYKGLDIPLSE